MKMFYLSNNAITAKFLSASNGPVLSVDIRMDWLKEKGITVEQLKDNAVLDFSFVLSYNEKKNNIVFENLKIVSV